MNRTSLPARSPAPCVFQSESSNMAAVCAASRVLGRKIVSSKAVSPLLYFAYFIFNDIWSVHAKSLTAFYSDVALIYCSQFCVGFVTIICWVK